MNKKLNISDKVTFESDKIELFKAETSSNGKAVQQYQKLVLDGLNQVGIVKDLCGNLTTVSYPDGWDLPVPTKYLVVLPRLEAPVKLTTVRRFKLTTFRRSKLTTPRRSKMTTETKKKKFG